MKTDNGTGNVINVYVSKFSEAIVDDWKNER